MNKPRAKLALVALIALASHAVTAQDQNARQLIQQLRSRRFTERRKAAQALGEMRAVQAVGPLVECLQDRTSSVSRAAEEALTKIGEPSVKPLTKMLSHRNPRVRTSAARALGRIGDKSAVAPLVECMKREQESTVRNVVMKALEDLGWKPESGEDEIAHAIARNQWSKLSAKGAEAVEPIIDALPNADPPTQRMMVSTLARIGDKKAVKPIIGMLRNRDKKVRREATDALATLDAQEAAGELVKCLDDKESLVQIGAANALKKLRWKPQTTDEKVAYAVAMRDEKAAAQPGRDAVPKLLTYMASGTYIRKTAVEALGIIGDNRAVDALVMRLDDSREDEKVRRAAIEALGAIGDAKAVRPLEDYLISWDLAPLAASALDKIGWKPKGDTEQIRYLLARRDREELTKSWQATKKVLLQDLNSVNDDASLNALRGLMSLGREDVIDELIQHLNVRGNARMGEMYLNSGNARLTEAAEQWAKNHGYKVTKFPVYPGKRVKWGGM